MDLPLCVLWLVSLHLFGRLLFNYSGFIFFACAYFVRRRACVYTKLHLTKADKSLISYKFFASSLHFRLISRLSQCQGLSASMPRSYQSQIGKNLSGVSLSFMWHVDGMPAMGRLSCLKFPVLSTYAYNAGVQRIHIDEGTDQGLSWSLRNFCERILSDEKQLKKKTW